MARINFIWLLLLTQVAFSQNCCSGGVPISSNIGVAPASKNTWQNIIIADVNYLNKLLRGSDQIGNDSRERTTASILLLFNYTLSDRISFDLTLPWVSQLRRNRAINGTAITESTSGVGDISLLIKYQLSSPKKTSSNFLIGAGIKVPSGSTKQLDSDRIILSLDMQPGSGSFDQFYWLFYSKRLSNNTSLYITSLFQLTGAYNSYNTIQSYKTGNSMVARLGLSRNFVLGSYLTTLNAELIPRKNWTDEVDNLMIPNTGGQWLFIKPGINFNLYPTLIFNLGAEFPLYSYVEGEQLSSTTRITFQIIHKIKTRESLR